MSRIPVSHKNRIRGETRDRIRSELNISTVQQTALDLKADISALGTAAYADLTISSTDATANRVTKVGDFGLGSRVVACPNVDLNDVVVTGFYDISGATLNKPPALSPTNAVCMTIVRTSDNMVQMVYNRRSHQIFQRYKNNTWSSWTEVLTDSNTNLNEFITNNIGERLLEGVAISTTEVDFPLPTPSFTYPTSITALGGYKIQDARSSTIVATGVLPALSPIATPNFTRVRFTVVGAVAGKRYLGIATSTNSKITVNF